MHAIAMNIPHNCTLHGVLFCADFGMSSACEGLLRGAIIFRVGFFSTCITVLFLPIRYWMRNRASIIRFTNYAFFLILINFFCLVCFSNWNDWEGMNFFVRVNFMDFLDSHRGRHRGSHGCEILVGDAASSGWMGSPEKCAFQFAYSFPLPHSNTCRSTSPLGRGP